MQQNGDTVAGKKSRNHPEGRRGLPDNTKWIAQEPIVNDKVNFIAGFGITRQLLPGQLATQAKMPEVVMAAGTSVFTERSPFIVSASLSWRSRPPSSATEQPRTASRSRDAAMSERPRRR
jgi:branched-chain amino acid transport system substrate-binding protein